jgi:Terminase large subunit, T4likevirus-type, N-terminal
MATIPPQAIDASWRQGILEWKLKPVQKQMCHAIRKSASLKYIVNSARRLGKSYLMCLMALEDALTIHNAQIRFAAPTQKALRKIVLPLFREICRDAPFDMRPYWKMQDGMLFCPSTNSEIHISGANNGHDENLRGTTAHKFYIDEAGFIDNLSYLVEDIAMPQLLTTNGNMVISSTPPRTPAHDFVAYAQAAQMQGNYAEYDIYKADFKPEIVKRFCEEAGGEHSTTWKREYLCQFVVDENLAIIPEWRDDFICEPPHDEYYKFYFTNEGMDLGVSDFTAVLFGYYDFKRAKLFVEDEMIMSGPRMTTKLLAEAIKAKERELWGDKPVKMRISDNNNPLLLLDLGSMHGMHFAAVQKDDLDAMVNELRLYVGAGRIMVHPRCKQTIGCLKFGIWQENRREFARSATFGHFDALAALIYLVRSMDVHTNPIPPLHNISEDTHYVSQEIKQTEQMRAVKDMLGFAKGRFN